MAVAFINEADFLQCMENDFPSLQICANDLMNPTGHTIKKYYITLLESLSGLSAGKICALSPEQREFLENSVEGPTIADHVWTNNLCSFLKYLFDEITQAESEFRYGFIVYPAGAPKHSFVFMATMYQFFVSCGEFDASFERLSRIQDKFNQVEMLKAKSIKLKEELSMKERRKIERAERVKEIQKKLIEYARSSEQSQSKLKCLQELHEVKKAKLAVLEDEERAHQEELVKLDNEKKYLESLVVSDESSIIHQHSALVSKKAECLKRIKTLEAMVHEKMTTLNNYEKVLTLQDTLNHTLQEDYSLGSQSLSFKDLYLTACSLQKEALALDKEEAELIKQIKEKESLVPSGENDCARLAAEIDSFNATWKEKLSKYDSLLKELQQSITEFAPCQDVFDFEMVEMQEKIEHLKEDYEAKRQKLNDLCKSFRSKVSLIEQTIHDYLHQQKEAAKIIDDGENSMNVSL